MSGNMTPYDDAELVAIQIVREAVREWSEAGYGCTKDVNDHLLRIQEQHPADEGAGVLGAVVALARFASIALTGPARPWAELPAFLDDWEMHKIEQHRAEQDGDI